MAVSTMTTSPNTLTSAFSPYSDSPSSPANNSSISRRSPAPMYHQSTERSNYLSAPTADGVIFNVPHAGTPVGLDITEPSPIAPSSNGTEFTDMEEDEGEKERRAMASKASAPAPQPSLKIRTATSQGSSSRPNSIYEDDTDEPQSVIHAPPGFRDLATPTPTNDETTPSATAAPSTAMSTESTTSIQSIDYKVNQQDKPKDSPSQRSDVTVTSPVNSESRGSNKSLRRSPISPPPLTTTLLPPPDDWAERATPQAQTRQEAEAFQRHVRNKSLEDIPETQAFESTEVEFEEQEDEDEEEEATHQFTGPSEIESLKTALSECWTLCNTLASLSLNHRHRMFGFSGQSEMQDQAWRSCWTLCKKLYESRDDNSTLHTRSTLDLCRDFCQALFEVRVRGEDVQDSVLRVSFELNNHLYNTHDRHLPEAFRERTLDFYVTLCHRLMKQKTRLADETDSLLRKCWALAEMLFSLRQNRREGRNADEDLLTSAVQACWDLCDLFRAGWTQVRPERTTPRPTQTTFAQVFSQARRSDSPSIPPPTPMDDSMTVPETPITIFEDTVAGGPGAPDPHVILFGQSEGSQSGRSSHSHRRKTPSPSNPRSTPQPYKSHRWPSNASTRSASSSHSSSHTASSTSTIKTSTSGGLNQASDPSEDPSLLLLKLLFIRAAQLHGGFSIMGSVTLPQFVKNLPATAFGTQSWQLSLLENYRRVVAGDPTFSNVGAIGVGGSKSGRGKATAGDVARAVQTMLQTGHFSWLRDLFSLVFGFGIEEIGNGKNAAMRIQI